MGRKERMKHARAGVSTVVLVLTAVLAVWQPLMDIRTVAAEPMRQHT